MKEKDFEIKLRSFRAWFYNHRDGENASQLTALLTAAGALRTGSNISIGFLPDALISRPITWRCRSH